MDSRFKSVILRLRSSESHKAILRTLAERGALLGLLLCHARPARRSRAIFPKNPWDENRLSRPPQPSCQGQRHHKGGLYSGAVPNAEVTSNAIQRVIRDSSGTGAFTRTR